MRTIVVPLLLLYVRVDCLRGMPLYAEDANGFTSLMGAAAAGHTELVNVLLSAGAFTDTRDSLGWTAYDAAIYNDHTAVASLLVRGWPQNTRCEKAITT